MTLGLSWTVGRNSRVTTPSISACRRSGNDKTMCPPWARESAAAWRVTASLEFPAGSNRTCDSWSKHSSIAFSNWTINSCFLSNSSVWERALTLMLRPLSQPSETRRGAAGGGQFVAEIHGGGQEAVSVGDGAGKLKYALVALGDRTVGFGIALEVVQLEISGHQLHRHEPLLGAFEIETAGDNGGDGDNFHVDAQQGDQTVLGFVVGVGGAHHQCAVFAGLHAGLDQFLKGGNGGGADFGVAFIGPNVGDGPQRNRLALLDDKPGGFGAGDGHGLGGDEIGKERRQIGPAVEQTLHQPGTLTDARRLRLLFLGFLRGGFDNA